MKRLLTFILLAGLVMSGAYACNEPTSGSGGSAVSKKSDTVDAPRKVSAPAEKQILNFNQSTSKDVHITDGPPEELTVSGLDGLKVD